MSEAAFIADLRTRVAQLRKADEQRQRGEQPEYPCFRCRYRCPGASHRRCLRMLESFERFEQALNLGLVPSGSSATDETTDSAGREDVSNLFATVHEFRRLVQEALDSYNLLASKIVPHENVAWGCIAGAFLGWPEAAAKALKKEIPEPPRIDATVRQCQTCETVRELRETLEICRQYILRERNSDWTPMMFLDTIERTLKKVSPA